MKSEKSIYNITKAAIDRLKPNVTDWYFTKLINQDSKKIITFDLIENEIPIIEIADKQSKTLISTRRILEESNSTKTTINFQDIQSYDFGNFKGEIDNPEIKKFRAIDFNNKSQNFQMESGKAAIVIITTLNTLKNLTKPQAIHNQKST
ncbi:hypothetical protein [Christiangramia forsetii]|uniref:Uncharacterized protein n=2 Tax=Christiangramia forsetii TaxID=411153 RepID=A0LZS1_CHRFK|nr:hypothetical protein [Christiangramia forsetii]GGG46569.1 hypothetical protein GCM10011532_33080 [Christiangramia forsetii]CAL65866.1 hypothetical protein GFO_0892 [Christiangramia forsetii KT0803]